MKFIDLIERALCAHTLGLAAVALVVGLAGCKKKEEGLRGVDAHAEAVADRAKQITLHRVGGGCVALYLYGDTAAMTAVPCPAAEVTP